MGVITIRGTITAVPKPALNKTACHFTGFTDVQGLNGAPVIAVGIVFLLQEFENIKSLNTVIVLNALMRAVILCMWGQIWAFLLGSVLNEVTGVSFHCVWRQSAWRVLTRFNVRQ